MKYIKNNIYTEKAEFYSARKVLKHLGKPFDDEIEVVSFHSLSKGLLGE